MNESPNSAQSMKWKIKRKSNDTLRQEFVDKTVPQVEYLGLTVPDSDLKWNEARGHYDFGVINWGRVFTTLFKAMALATKSVLPTMLRHMKKALGCAKPQMLSPRKQAQRKKKYRRRPHKPLSLMNKDHWKLWEVFLRSKNGLSHKHVGSLHAADAEMAIQNARGRVYPQE